MMPPNFKKARRSRTGAGRWKNSGRACASGRASRAHSPSRSPRWPPGERAGWRPSLVVTPTIVELGRRLLISNLDFSSSDKGTLCNGIQFFQLFPDRAGLRRSDDPQIARQKVLESLSLSTAIRMNAAFPIITPCCRCP